MEKSRGVGWEKSLGVGGLVGNYSTSQKSPPTKKFRKSLRFKPSPSCFYELFETKNLNHGVGKEKWG